MSTLTLACAIIVGLMLAYAWGYRNGVAYCVREMKPLVTQLRELRMMVQKRGP